LKNIISIFVAKYSKYATIPNQQLFKDNTIAFNKVPTQEVYYRKCTTDRIVKIWGEVTQPTTLILEDCDPIIE
jgi:hypothetical protein